MTVVFTNGCFDLLHEGHIHLLRESKKLGTKLIVAINSDASIKLNKGPQRPIENQETRKFKIEQLNIADEIIIFDDTTPFSLIQSIWPDIITKGSDYSEHDVVGCSIAKVVIIPRLPEFSTTGIINAKQSG